MVRPTRPSSHALVPALWLGAVLATQAWPSWQAGIRDRFATDVLSYEQIARAAPGLPGGPLPQQHAERFPVHWTVGVLADVTGADLHIVYRVLTIALLLALVGVTADTLRRLALDVRTRVVAVGLLVASAYPVRYLLAAPGMAADALFLVGLALVVWAFVADRDAVLVVGLVVAVLGRQTAVPVALAAAAALAVRGRYGVAAGALLLPVLLYAALHVVAERFAQGGVLDSSDSVVSALDRPREMASHLGRMALVLVVPAAVTAGAWLRTRVRPAPTLLALAAAVVVQPLLLDPEWVAKNEPRLTALALPALAVACVAPLTAAALGSAETAVVAVAIFVASLHARYSDVGLTHSSEWAALAAVGAAVIFVVLARRQAKSRVPSAASQVAGTPRRR